MRASQTAPLPGLAFQLFLAVDAAGGLALRRDWLTAGAVAGARRVDGAPDGGNPFCG
jgi:hypothetical protein